jgi:hypothetical protein
MSAVAVPFQFDATLLGLLSHKGLLRDEGDHLCVEYQAADQLLGAYRGRVRQVRVPLADIAAVTFHAPRFGGWARIELRSNRLEPLAALPGASQGRVVLHIARDDREAARKLFDGLHVPVEVPAGG